LSSLKNHQKHLLEELLQMKSGYVLDFSDKTFTEFFEDFGVNIYDDKYLTPGSSGSKANRLRAFWEIESDELTGHVLYTLLERVKGKERSTDQQLTSARQIIEALLKKDEIRFLQQSFEINFDAMNIIDCSMKSVLNRRVEEISICLNAGAFLACIIMAGSLLEGLLIELGKKNIEFNTSPSSPKNRDKKVKKIHEWTLEELINVAYQSEFISADVKKFSSSLRDFRNYIHPQEQLKSQFHPDKHTATIAIQVLKAAIADMSNERASTKLSDTLI
jgi:hypothetical protein